MPLTIWKAVLPLQAEVDIEVPQGADFLCASAQHNQIAVWYRCDPKKDKVRATLIIRGTGDMDVPYPSQGRYLGTAHLRGGNLIMHVFEKLA
jgi:hypothetical protein